MIRRLQEADRTALLDYLYKEQEYNIFIIGDIEAFGFDSDFQQVHADIDEQGKYHSVLLFYRMHAIYYADKTHFNELYLPLLTAYPFTAIIGKKALIDVLVPHLPDWVYRPMYFAKANTLLQPANYDDLTIRVLESEEDASKLYDLLASIKEFTIHSQSREEFVDGKMKSKQMGHTYYMEENGMFVSTVATTAETTVNAMVVAVATAPSHRNKGLASKLMTKLMEEYFNNKRKSLCLFFDNPKAGAIYKRLGFEEMGQWVILQKGE